ncbi:MAG: hypothetical protein AB7V15_03210, partial [Acidimicrobiia bacterium]
MERGGGHRHGPAVPEPDGPAPVPGRGPEGALGGFGRRELLRRGAITAGAAALAPHLLARLVEAPVPLGPTRLATTTLGAPPVIARAAWGADETIGTRTRFFAPLRKAIVHHTAVDSPDPYGDPEGQLRAVQRAHVNNGWADIGYQFAVAPDGRIFEGRYARPFGPGEVPSGEDANGNLVIGAHAENHNTGSLGVVLLGDLSGRDPTP